MRNMVTHFRIKYSDGRELGVKKIQEMPEATNFQSSEAEHILGMAEYLVEDGTHLYPLETGVYRVQETGEIVMPVL